LVTSFDKNTAAGYNEVQVPHMVNEASAYGTGQLPDKEECTMMQRMIYIIPGWVPVTNMFRDVILRKSARFN
jgi:seryl-tRNA synthetase